MCSSDLVCVTHQAGRVELLLAGATGLLGQRVVGAVDNGEADHAVLHPLETLVHVVLPQSQALHDAAVLHARTHTHTRTHAHTHTHTHT